jgi:NADH dehydrogenase [ubiquinone] 1 alpha subcomplex assembly factor 4
VTSSNIENPKIESEKSKLPQNRRQVEDFEFGFLEIDPLKIGRGKCSLRQAIQFISDHQTNPNEWTANKIANEFKLKEDAVGEYFLKKS